MSTRFNILSGVVVSFLAVFFLVPTASANEVQKGLPFPVRVIGGTDFVCQVNETDEVSCVIENGRYGDVTVSFPAGTQAMDSVYGVVLEIRNVNGRLGLRIEGAQLPLGMGEVITLPRRYGLAGSRLCVRDFPGAGFASPDSPCFVASGQGRVDVPLGNGEMGFYLSDGVFRQVSYGPNTITLHGLRHTSVMFDHNQSPIANDDTCQAYEDERVICSVLTNDVDLDGDLLRLSEVSRPMFGTAWISDHGIAYEPPEEWVGIDHFRYFVTDGRATALAEVTVRVDPTNDLPVAVKDVVFVDEDGEGLFDLVQNDYDRDSATLTLQSIGTPEHGAATISGGLLRYVPQKDWFGEDGLSYVVSDGAGGETQGEVKVLVREINDAPVAKSANASTREDISVSGKVTATDKDGDALIFFLASRPSNGRIDFSEDGTWSYLPNKDYFGSDGFEFFVTDGHEVSNQAEVSISVSFVQDDDIVVVETDDSLVYEDFPRDYWNSCFSWMTDCDAVEYDGPKMGDDLGIVKGIQLAREAGRDDKPAPRLADYLSGQSAKDGTPPPTTADLIWQLIYYYLLRPLFGGWF